MMEEMFIPTLHYFAMDNLYTGSHGLLRFRIQPNIVKATAKEVDFAQSSMTAQVWHGLFCYEKSEVEAAETFPMSEDGRSAMIQWLRSYI